MPRLPTLIETPTKEGSLLKSGQEIPTRDFFEGGEELRHRDGLVPHRTSIVKVEVIELEPPKEMKAEGRESGWRISVDPWLAPVHKNAGDDRREMLVWVCDYPIAIRFDQPGHFYETRPFSLGTKVIDDLSDEELVKKFSYFAYAGPVKPAVPVRLGPFKYTIDIFPKSNVVLTVDPEYVVEESGKAP